MGENFANWFALFNEQENGFSSFLVLGTDIVAGIADKLFTDMPPCRGYARCHHPSYF